MANTWPGGIRHAMTQSQHADWNATHYPGTRQLCSRCGDPTERCEEDGLWDDEGEPLCDECYAEDQRREDESGFPGPGSYDDWQDDWLRKGEPESES